MTDNQAAIALLADVVVSLTLVLGVRYLMRRKAR